MESMAARASCFVPWSANVSRTIASNWSSGSAVSLARQDFSASWPASVMAYTRRDRRPSHAGSCRTVAKLAGEAYVHGRDVARALGRPWPLDADDMRTIFVGLLPVLPHYVDRDGAVGFAASFDVRLRGDPTSRARFEFDTGHLTVRQCDGRRVDCRVSAEPATFVLILYGRSGQMRPVLTGRVVASGRKPWLGLTLPR